MSTVLRIRLDPPRWTTCNACGAETDGLQGLPVDDTGAYVANDYAGEWGAVPACRRCFEVHAAGGPAALTIMLHYERRAV